MSNIDNADDKSLAESQRTAHVRSSVTDQQHTFSGFKDRNLSDDTRNSNLNIKSGMGMF